MKVIRHNRVAWKLSGLISILFVLVLGGLTYLNTLDDRAAALAVARDVSRMDSITLIQSLNRMMTSDDSTGFTRLIEVVSRDNPLYEDIQLLDHEGRIVASFEATDSRPLKQDAWPCHECHRAEMPISVDSVSSLDRVFERPDGSVLLTVVSPIENLASCQLVGCHGHMAAGRPIGFLKLGYSLERVDSLVAQHRTKALVGMLFAIVVSTCLVWLATQRLVGRRIQWLTDGVRRVTSADFNYRFEGEGKDEFALLAASLNEMTGQLSTTMKALKRTREYMEGIVENSADIIITVDPDGLIKTFNAGAETTLGYSRDEVIGKRVEILFSDPSERDAAIAQLEYTDHVVNYETHFLTKDGRIRNVILTLSKLRRGDGTAIGTYGISKDVTREKRLQRQLLQAERLAALGQAITGIQHSIKNLLNVLKGGAYMVEKGLEKKDDVLLNDGWSMVQEGISRMTQFSTSMLKFVKDRRPELSEVNLQDLVEKVFDLTKSRFEGKGVAFHMDLRDEVPAVYCDPELIHSVLMDLLSNALDACLWKEYAKNENPEVRLALKGDPEGEEVTLTVSDNGEGMSETVQSKLFTPLFSTKKGKGTGMGLSVAARVIHSHGGKITVESEPGFGSTFVVTLPVRGPGENKESQNV